MPCYEYPPIGGGGASVVQGLSTALARQGHQVDVLTMGFRDLPKKESHAGITVYRVSCWRKKQFVCTMPEATSYLWAAHSAALRLAKQNRYDFNHTHFIFPDGIVARRLRAKTGLPYLFITMGKSRDAQWEQELRARYANLPNLEITGFIDQFSSPRYAEVLERSWIIVNSATREALPNAFLEAASYQCAILSFADPDGFVSKFGYHAQNDDFADGLELLLKDENWKVRGQRGYDYVKHTFELERAIDWHLDTYRCLLSA